MFVIQNCHVSCLQQKLTFAEYGLPVVGLSLTVTLILCSPTDRGTKSALKTPSATCDTCAGIDCPIGPISCNAISISPNDERSQMIFLFYFVFFFFLCF